MRNRIIIIVVLIILTSIIISGCTNSAVQEVIATAEPTNIPTIVLSTESNSNFFSYLLILISGLVVGGFLKSYMMKKGENLATKEDIEGITKIVESTKSDYVKEIESLKSELSKELNDYVEESKLKTSDMYLRYTNLYSKLYIPIVQSEYIKYFIDIGLAFEDYPFIEETRIKTREKITLKGSTVEKTRIEDEVTKLNKQYLLDVTFQFPEYASENLLKIAVAYRYVHRFYLDTTNDFFEKFQNEEIRLIKEFVETIIKETNELKRDLGFEYNDSELSSGRLSIEKIASDSNNK